MASQCLRENKEGIALTWQLFKVLKAEQVVKQSHALLGLTFLSQGLKTAPSLRAAEGQMSAQERMGCKWEHVSKGKAHVLVWGSALPGSQTWCSPCQRTAGSDIPPNPARLHKWQPCHTGQGLPAWGQACNPLLSGHQTIYELIRALKSFMHA